MTNIERRDVETMREQGDGADLIDRAEVRRLLGNPSVSTLYNDPEIRALTIPMTAPGRRTKMVRWLRSDILELRRERIERARANAEAVRQRVIEQNQRRRDKQKQNTAA